VATEAEPRSEDENSAPSGRHQGEGMVVDAVGDAAFGYLQVIVNIRSQRRACPLAIRARFLACTSASALVPKDKISLAARDAGLLHAVEP
jgi:hypothetical protein